MRQHFLGSAPVPGEEEGADAAGGAGDEGNEEEEGGEEGGEGGGEETKTKTNNNNNNNNNNASPRPLGKRSSNVTQPHSVGQVEQQKKNANPVKTFLERPRQQQLSFQRPLAFQNFVHPPVSQQSHAVQQVLAEREEANEAKRSAAAAEADDEAIQHQKLDGELAMSAAKGTQSESKLPAVGGKVAMDDDPAFDQAAKDLKRKEDLCALVVSVLRKGNHSSQTEEEKNAGTNAVVGMFKKKLTSTRSRANINLSSHELARVDSSANN